MQSSMNLLQTSQHNLPLVNDSLPFRSLNIANRHSRKRIEQTYIAK